MTVFAVAVNYGEETPASSNGEESSNLDLIYKALLSNRNLNGNKAWMHVAMVALISFMSIYFIRQTRNLARKAYELQNSWTTKSQDQDQLKYHTVHFKGIPSEDRTGNGLRLLLDKFLATRGGSSMAI